MTAPSDHEVGDLKLALVEMAARAGRLVVELPGEPWPELARDGRGFIYVLAFDDGLIKVGHTRAPARRLSEFKRDARRYGRVLVNGYLSRETGDPAGAESATILRVRRAGGRSRSGAEYFDGVDFDVARRIAIGAVIDCEANP
jgi:hypothetical protein